MGSAVEGRFECKMQICRKFENMSMNLESATDHGICYPSRPIQAGIEYEITSLRNHDHREQG